MVWMRIRRGASLADLERIYRARFGALVRVATAVTGEESLGADAVHDAFVQAVRHRNSYRGDGPLEAWVWRLVVNAAKKRVPRAEPLVADSAVLSENGAGDPVRAAVAALPERQRLILFLRYYADLDYEAIAATLGVSSGTVGATLNAAHAALRSSLKEADQWT
jgi:DNA-directed RNA polymerase specialized sigma24 family protein